MGNYILPRTPIHLEKGEKKSINLNKLIHIDRTEFSIESNLQAHPARINVKFASNTGSSHSRMITLLTNPYKGSLYSPELANNLHNDFQIDVIEFELLSEAELFVAFSIIEY